MAVRAYKVWQLKGNLNLQIHSANHWIFPSVNILSDPTNLLTPSSIFSQTNFLSSWYDICTKTHSLITAAYTRRLVSDKASKLGEFGSKTSSKASPLNVWFRNINTSLSMIIVDVIFSWISYQLIREHLFYANKKLISYDVHSAKVSRTTFPIIRKKWIWRLCDYLDWWPTTHTLLY